VADFLAGFGADPSEVEIAVAFAPSESGVAFQAGAIRVPGRDWAAVLEALGDVGERGDGVKWEWAEVGGRRVLQTRAPGWADSIPTTYTHVGDTLFHVQSGDEEVVEEFVSGLPEAGGDGPGSAYELPPPGAGPLAIFVLGQPIPPVCVAEPPGRQHLRLLVIDAGLGAPVPFTTFTVTGQLMSNSFIPPPLGGPLLDIPYAAARYGGALGERLLVAVQALQGGYGQYFLTFPVQHCLQGTWQDGDRVVRISPPYSESITAEVLSGDICGEEGGIDFTGVLEGDRLTGEDLKVCNPDECVEAGFLAPSTTVSFTGQVADDGMSVNIDWTGDFYQFEEDSQGNLLSCNATSTEDHSFTITRLTFGE